MTDPIFIIGAGQAGLKVAETLRQKGFDGPLYMIGDETTLPYQRPPLSKAFLKGETPSDKLTLKPSTWFEDHNIEFLAGQRVEELTPSDQRLKLADGRVFTYGKVVLTTGTRARSLRLSGETLAGVHALRTLEDAAKIANALQKASNIVVIGGGFVGMEFAASARSLDKSVTVLEAAPRILQRAVSKEMSDYLSELHSARGVDLRLNAKVSSLEGGSQVETVKLEDGSALIADLVLIAAGAVANTELAKSAGLDVARGILVESSCQTSDRNIFAAGDCTEFYAARFDQTVMLESVQNANDQAKATAASLLGEPVSYDPIPWFWSDQYDVKLQMAGLADNYDRTEFVGDMDDGRFSFRYFAGSRLVAVHSINDARSHMMARKELAIQPGLAA